MTQGENDCKPKTLFLALLLNIFLTISRRKTLNRVKPFIFSHLRDFSLDFRAGLCQNSSYLGRALRRGSGVLSNNN